MSALFDRIEEHARSVPERPALRGSGVSIRYGELEDTIRRTAELLSRFVPDGRPVAWIADNGPGPALLDLALAYMGRTSLPIPPFFSDDQRWHVLQDAGAGTLLIQGAPSASAPLSIASSSFEVRRLAPPAVALPEGTAKVTYTSGSTGRPKGVCLSQATLEATAAAVVEAVGIGTAGVHCPVLPLAVLLENVAGHYAVLMAGGTYRCEPLATLGLGRPFAPEFARMAEALLAAEATSTILVPELLRGLIGALAGSHGRLPAMRFVAVGGARVAPRLLAAAAAVGLPVYEGYGLTEAGSVVSLNTPEECRPGSVGRFLPHVDADVTSDGELLLRRPLFLGYTGSSLPPQAHATGDLVRIDAEGYLAIEGRRSNVLITGFGRNVSPEWVESELLAQPAIGQAMVVGDGAAQLAALLVPASTSVGTDAIAAAVDAANRTLPAYAQVGAWRVVPPFAPHNGLATANGRLKRETISAAHASLIATMIGASDDLLRPAHLGDRPAAPVPARDAADPRRARRADLA
ncbi:MAG: AMP-binding protein [Hyphomicrobiales bacterium]